MIEGCDCAICGGAYFKDKYDFGTSDNIEKAKLDMIHTFVGDLCPNCFNPTLDAVIKKLVCGEYTSATEAIKYTMRRERVTYWRHRMRLEREKTRKEEENVIHDESYCTCRR